MNQILDQFFHSIGALLDEVEACFAPYLPDQTWAAILAFAFYLLLITSGGLVAVLARNLVRATLGLIVTFLGVAGFYLLLASPFLALMQLLIYVGAVCVLVFFAVMLTKNTSDGDEARLPKISNVILATLAALAPLIVAGPLVYHGSRSIPDRQPADSGAMLGEGLLSIDLLSFELISIVLLVAMAGAVYLAKKPK
jgi:NADH-quinone oxidoreductase subunit J